MCYIVNNGLWLCNRDAQNKITALQEQKGPKYVEIRKKIVEKAKMHGEHTAILKAEQDSLIKEREFIVNQIKNKNLSENDHEMLLNNMEEQYQKKMIQLHQLKKKLKNEEMEHEKELEMQDKLFEELTNDPSGVDLRKYYANYKTPTKSVRDDTGKENKNQDNMDIHKNDGNIDINMKQNNEQDLERAKTSRTKPVTGKVTIVENAPILNDDVLSNPHTERNKTRNTIYNNVNESRYNDNDNGNSMYGRQTGNRTQYGNSNHNHNMPHGYSHQNSNNYYPPRTGYNQPPMPPAMQPMQPMQPPYNMSYYNPYMPYYPIQPPMQTWNAKPHNDNANNV